MNISLLSSQANKIGLAFGLAANSQPLTIVVYFSFLIILALTRRAKVFL